MHKTSILNLAVGLMTGLCLLSNPVQASDEESCKLGYGGGATIIPFPGRQPKPLTGVPSEETKKGGDVPTPKEISADHSAGTTDFMFGSRERDAEVLQLISILPQFIDIIRDGAFHRSTQDQLNLYYRNWLTTVDLFEMLQASPSMVSASIMEAFRYIYLDAKAVMDDPTMKQELLDLGLHFGKEILYMPGKALLPDALIDLSIHIRTMADALERAKRPLLTGGNLAEALPELDQNLEAIEDWISFARRYVRGQTRYDLADITITATAINRAYLKPDAFLQRLRDTADAREYLRRLEGIRGAILFLSSAGRPLRLERK